MPTFPLTLHDRHFFDPQGRQVLLHGINLVDKNPASGYLSFSDPAIFTALRNWGLNCVRLGVIWDGLEPEPGKIAHSYLDGLERQVALAWSSGLYVFLDMHQDLYSRLFSDGAPAWATLSGDQLNPPNAGVWSDAYFTNPAVQTALDRFWANAPAPDGQGLQEHYAQVWQALAQRFAHRPGIIGFDLMNEPFPGSAAADSQLLMLAEGARLLAEKEGAASLDLEQVAARWLDASQRIALLEKLGGAEEYGRVIAAAYPIYAAFESGPLMAFYRRLAQALTASGSNVPLFLETSMGSNMGIPSAIQALPGVEQVYAPHGYDLVVDTDQIAHSSPERVRLIFQRHAETAARLGLPMVVGEWGAFGFWDGTLPAARAVVGEFEKLQCGETYWAFERGLEKAPCFRAIHRPYPERLAGRLLHACYDAAANRFECAWQESASVAAPSRIYLPDWLKPAADRLQIEPAGSAFLLEQIPAAPGGAWLNVPPLGQERLRRLSIQAPG